MYRESSHLGFVDETNTYLGVSEFVDRVIAGDTSTLRADPGLWEEKVRNRINQFCHNKVDWEAFTSVLALKLGTGYGVGEEYEFILNLLSNAAYLKRKPYCKKCGSRRTPMDNALVLVCPYCEEPVHKDML